MNTDKVTNRMVEVLLVEVTKADSNEKKRTVDGISGSNLDIEFIGGIWKERKLKFPCPECQGRNTTIELSIHEVGWDGIGHFDKSGGSIESLLGSFTIYCDDCKKLFSYSPYGNIDLDFIEEIPYDEKL